MSPFAPCLKKLSPSPKTIEVFGKPPPVPFPCDRGGDREGDPFIQCPLPSSLMLCTLLGCLNRKTTVIVSLNLYKFFLLLNNQRCNVILCKCIEDYMGRIPISYSTFRCFRHSFLLCCNSIYATGNFKQIGFEAEMVFCYQNCSDLLWEKIVLVMEKNFWNSRLKAENLQNFWDH